MTGERQISILGLGLMGASLAMALRARGYGGRLTAFARRAETRETAVDRGVVDAAYGSVAEAVEGASLVVLCAPVRASAELGVELAPLLKPGMLVTDVASTKAWICRELGEKLGGAFIGSHPIAGSEKQGLEAASAKLYEGALTVVTPGEGADEDSVRRIESLWESVGSRVCRMGAEEHDRILARSSHLPHMAAAALAAAIGRDDANHVGAFCGTGFYDSTRLAAGSVEMWKDILMTNAGAVAEELRAFNLEIERVYNDLQAGRFAEVAAFLERARFARESLLKGQVP